MFKGSLSLADRSLSSNWCSQDWRVNNRYTFHSRPGQEAQKIFKANQPMDGTQVKTKLIGFGFSLLEGIDPNPENYVCAGIIHTKSIQIGCLLRLEPNSSAQVSWILWLGYLYLIFYWFSFSQNLMSRGPKIPEIFPADKDPLNSGLSWRTNQKWFGSLGNTVLTIP